MDCFEIKDGNSIVRVFHASPDAPAVDIYIDGKLAVPNLSYTDISNYSYLEEGIHTVDVHPAGDEQTVILSKMVDVPDGRIFTISIVNNLDNLELLLIEDDIDEIPSPKEAAVRVIHLSPNAPSVDILANDNILFNDLEFKEATDYVKVPAGSYNIDIALTGTDDIILSGNVNLRANKIYTLYAVGNPPGLGIIQSVDVNSYLCR